MKDFRRKADNGTLFPWSGQGDGFFTGGHQHLVIPPNILDPLADSPGNWVKGPRHCFPGVAESQREFFGQFFWNYLTQD